MKYKIKHLNYKAFLCGKMYLFMFHKIQMIFEQFIGLFIFLKIFPLEKWWLLKQNVYGFTPYWVINLNQFTGLKICDKTLSLGQKLGTDSGQELFYQMPWWRLLIFFLLSFFLSHFHALRCLSKISFSKLILFQLCLAVLLFFSFNSLHNTELRVGNYCNCTSLLSII